MYRPSTLKEVSERVLDGEDATKLFSEFLDHFYDRRTKSQMVACFVDEPPLVAGLPRLDAMYAATAEYLSKRYWLNSIPEWIDAPERYLDQPWFVTSNRDLHELLTFYSPAEFRSRNIFTEAAPLRRART